MKGFIGVIIIIFSGLVSFGQGSGNYQGRIEASWTPGAYVATKSKEAGESIGSEFLHEEWYYGNIRLYTGEINGYPLKYSLLHSRIEIMTPEGIKILNDEKVKDLTWKSPLTLDEQVFVNGKDLSSEGVPMTGLLEVLYQGKIGLYKRYYLKVKKGTYVPSHDVGQIEDEYRIYEVIMAELDNNLIIVQKKKDFLSIFGEDSDNIKEYSKSGKLSFTEPSDLVEMIKYWESSYK